MRIEAIFPSFYNTVPQITGISRQAKIPEISGPNGIPGTERNSVPERLPAAPQYSLYNPPIVVDISPEGWDAYRRNKSAIPQNPAILQNPANQTNAAPKSNGPRTIPVLRPNNGTSNITDVFEPHECQTCKNRKYQDGSSDPSVSYQAPTHISPNQAGAAVAAHEGEHVAHEQAKAQQEDRQIVSQTVSLSTSICPECGRVYISGGVTRTITASKPDNSPEVPENT